MSSAKERLTFKNVNKVVLAGMLVVAVAIGILSFSFANKTESGILNIGKTAPLQEMKMKDVSGEAISLKTIAKKNGVLVIFTSNLCPFVVGNGARSEGWEGRYPEIYNLASKSDIGMVLVNSNEAARDRGESMDDMKRHYKEKGYLGYLALDANHELADAFGALTTPHVFLFDEDMKLIYRGLIDDAVDSSKAVKEPYLKNAIAAHLAGNEIKPNSTRQIGCSIKRVKK